MNTVINCSKLLGSGAFNNGCMERGIVVLLRSVPQHRLFKSRVFSYSESIYNDYTIWQLSEVNSSVSVIY